jgi:hypothetical protein
MMEHRSDFEPTGDAVDGLPAEDPRELRPALEELAAWARGAAERPENFWERQRAAVWMSLAAQRRRTAQRLGTLAAAVCLLLIALAIFGVNQRAPKAPLQVRSEHDQQLMLRVEQTMQSDGPEALEPAALLVQQVSAGTNASSRQGESSEGEKRQ